MTYGINQTPPSSPTFYPFIAPDPRVDALVQDLYLSFEDDLAEFVFPFYLTWLNGFGTDTPDVTGATPVASNAQDVLIVDAIGSPVFNSSLGSATATEHGDLRTVIWRRLGNVLQLSYVKSVEAVTPSEFTVMNEIDSRNLNQIPLRVRTIRVQGVSYSGDIELVAGNNMELSLATEVSGTRDIGSISFAATPGAGDGRTDGCLEPDDSIKTINKVGPDDGGNFLIDMSDCYRIQRPGQLGIGIPRDFTPGGAEFVSDMTSQLNGQPLAFIAGDDPSATISAILASNYIAASSLRVQSDCYACCKCVDYENVYKAIIRINTQLDTAAAHMELVRDNYVVGIERWNGQLACRENKPQRLIVRNAYSCRVQIAGLFFNFSECCIADAFIRMTIVHSRGGSPLATEFISYKPETFRAGFDTDYVDEPAVLVKTANSVQVNFDAINVHSIMRMRTTLKFPNCQVGDVVSVTMTTHFADQLDAEGNPCYPDITDQVDVATRALWSDSVPVRAVLVDQTTITPSSGYCCN